MTSQSKGKNARRRERLFASGVHVPRATHPNSTAKRRGREAAAATAAANIAATTADSAGAETMPTYNTEIMDSSNDVSNDGKSSSTYDNRTRNAYQHRHWCS